MKLQETFLLFVATLTVMAQEVSAPPTKQWYSFKNPTTWPKIPAYDASPVAVTRRVTIVPLAVGLLGGVDRSVIIGGCGVKPTSSGQPAGKA